MNNANSDTEKAFDAAPVVDANHQNDDQGTHHKDNVDNNQSSEGEQIDYKKKFAASTTENQRLIKENEEKEAEIERLRLIAEEKANGNSGNHEDNSEQADDTEQPLYPGFEQLDQEAQENLLNYTKAVEHRVKGEIFKDPAIAHSRQIYNEKKWNDAFAEVVTKFPLLQDSQGDFKQKYFQPNNVPDNIAELMESMAKIHLFDKNKEEGAKEERERSERIDTERAHGGDKQPKASRTLEEWEHLATTDPVKFAKMSKEYHADLEAGKLKA